MDEDLLEAWLNRMEFECEHAGKVAEMFREGEGITTSAPTQIWRRRIATIRALQQNQKKGKKRG